MGSSRKRQAAELDSVAAEHKNKTENERISQLETENLFLRKQLTMFVGKLELAQTSLRGLCNMMHAALEADDDISSQKLPSADEPSAEVSARKHPGSASDSLDYNHYLPSTSPTHASNSHEDIALEELLSSAENCFSGACQHPCQGVISNAAVDLQVNPSMNDAIPPGQIVSPCIEAHESTFMGSPSQGIPGVWSYHYQMGPSNYQSAMANICSIRTGLPISNSAFSDHIAALHSSKLHLSVSLMLSLFNSLNRPLALSWYTPTKFYYHITNLTTWQLNPTREMYMRLPARYRPSALQLSEAYPPIIDWCPFPSIRDKLILLHSANSNIDQIICDIAMAYVVEADISTIVHLEGPTTGYIRVWDLIQAMGKPGHEQICSSQNLCAETSIGLGSHLDAGKQADFGGYALPAPSTEALFRTKEYARLAFKELHMDDGISRYKLDAALFEKYPELYEPDDNIVAKGVAVRAPRQTAIPVPKALDRFTLDIYRHFADWSLNVIFSTKF
ncbi:uncharacterized protein CDV56_108779 [Aspergillus thermomutatus]|uniref:BZIP domain-containing protein n=1 Tax=Aspergillus thermomutatus TaxID=41047 RepID=A0A397HQS7_ASPTH|nr:uncharacterized protein CDV56_108779 [Aspergillus thermomutatus]RHZ65521.1 hypothetical protein CDV56_108779 [Aspergillus thermomutatus]